MSAPDMFAPSAEATIPDPALAALEEWRRICAEKDINSIGRNEPDPAWKCWDERVTTARPVTFAGAIALLEETVEGAEQPDLIQNVIAFLRRVAPKGESQPVRDLTFTPEH